MENVLTTILSSSIIATLVAGLITKITEGRIQSTFDKKLESVKKEHTLEIAKFQSELDSLKAKENFKFTKLHEERFNVLKNTYRLVNKSRNDLALFVSEIKVIPRNTTAEKNLDRLNEIFRNSHEEFVRYVDDNLIFYSENLESILADFLEKSFQIFIDYDTNIVLKHAGIVNEEIRKKAVTAYKRVLDDIHPISVTIKKEIREMLGANL